MNLKNFKNLLASCGTKELRMQLPSGDQVPLSFHITEVGRVEKTFVDCGGEMRQSVTCQLQVWVGEDEEHRIPAAKTVSILDKAAKILPDDSIPVEIEYEGVTISQYPIESWEATPSTLVLQLGQKHTDCLARELCGVPAEPSTKETCCGPKGCC